MQSSYGETKPGVCEKKRQDGGICSIVSKVHNGTEHGLSGGHSG